MGCMQTLPAIALPPSPWPAVQSAACMHARAHQGPMAAFTGGAPGRGRQRGVLVLTFPPPGFPCPGVPGMRNSPSGGCPRPGGSCARRARRDWHYEAGCPVVSAGARALQLCSTDSYPRNAQNCPPATQCPCYSSARKCIELPLWHNTTRSYIW